MKKIIPFIFFVSIIFLSVYCNQNERIKKSEKDFLTVKADSFFTLGKMYSDDSLNQKKALKFYDKSFDLFKKIENKPKMAKILQYIAYAYDYNEDYPSVIKYHKKALKINTEIDDKRMAAISTNNLGIAYTIIGDLDSAHYYYDKGIELTEITRDTVEFIELYQNMGISYEYAGNYEKAIESAVKALSYSEKINYVNSIAGLNLHIAQYYNNIGNSDKASNYCKNASDYINRVNNSDTQASFYNTLGELYYSDVKYIQARKNFIITLEISEKANYKRGMASAYINLAKLALKEHKFEDAEKYCNLSINLENRIDDKTGLIVSLITLAEAQYKLKNYNKALFQLKKAESICKENGIFENLPDIFYQKYEIYKLIGEFNSALKYYENYSISKDSLTGIELKEKIEGIEIKYQTEKKQHKIKLLHEENMTKEEKLKARNFLIISLVLIVFIIIGIAYFFKQKAKHRLNKIELEIQKYILQIRDFNTQKSTDTELKLKKFSKKHQLTERETDVLLLIGEGKSNAEIANEMFISSNTVKFHIKNIYLKLDVKNRVEARNKIAG